MSALSISVVKLADYSLCLEFLARHCWIILLKSQGRRSDAKIRIELAQGRAPVGSIADSISLAAGGILMLIPGYVTDGIGVCYLSQCSAQLRGVDFASIGHK